MKLSNLILFLLPLTGFSQVDSSYLNGDLKETDIKIAGDTVFYHYGRPTQVYYLTKRKMTIDSVYRIDGEHLYFKKSPAPKLYKLPKVPKNIGATTDTLPTYGGITSNSLQWYSGSRWYDNWTTELVKGRVETPINVMDSGMKVEVVETRDTIYKCPYSNFTYFTYDYNVGNTKAPRSEDCKLDKIVTTRRYKLYIINEYGQKEYLSMEFQHQKK